MIRNNDPVGFLRTAKKAITVMKDAHQNATPEQRAARGELMYRDRWKNLAWSMLFAAVTGGACYALWFIPKIKLTMHVISWGILSVMCALLFILALITAGVYLKLIVKGVSE